MTAERTPLVELGVLGKTFQLAGGLRFYPHGEAEAEALLGLGEVVLEGVGPCRVREVREVGGGIVLYLSRALSREAAQALVNCRVLAPAEVLPEAEDDLGALVGLPVLLEGEPYGEVEDVLEAGLNDLLLLRRPDGGEALVPLRAPYVALDEDAVRLSDVPEGLL